VLSIVALMYFRKRIPVEFEHLIRPVIIRHKCISLLMDYKQVIISNLHGRVVGIRTILDIFEGSEIIREIDIADTESVIVDSLYIDLYL